MLLQLASLFTAIVAVLSLQEVTHNPSPPRLNLRRGDLLAPTLTAQSVFLFDLGNGEILLQKNADEKRPIASITKLVTALTLLDKNPHWQTLITFESGDKRNGGIPYLIPGEQLTIKDAWNLMLVGSSNDAAALLARVFYDSEDNFVEAMNAKVRELGLKHTRFTDSTGLQAGNISTARETAAIARLALGHEAIRNAVRLRQVNIYPKGKAPRLVYSTNWLLSSPRSSEQIFGGKTGHIEDSGYNLVLASGRDGQEIIGVVLGSESNEARFTEMRALLNWGFENSTKVP